MCVLLFIRESGGPSLHVEGKEGVGWLAGFVLDNALCSLLVQDSAWAFTAPDSLYTYVWGWGEECECGGGVCGWGACDVCVYV